MLHICQEWIFTAESNTRKIKGVNRGTLTDTDREGAATITHYHKESSDLNSDLSLMSEERKPRPTALQMLTQMSSLASSHFSQEMWFLSYQNLPAEGFPSSSVSVWHSQEWQYTTLKSNIFPSFNAYHKETFITWLKDPISLFQMSPYKYYYFCPLLLYIFLILLRERARSSFHFHPKQHDKSLCCFKRSKNFLYKGLNFKININIKKLKG